MTAATTRRRAWQDLTGAAGRVAGAVLDLLLPPACPACGTETGAQGGLCARCWKDVAFIDGSMCARCGLPFEADPGPDALCGGCLAHEPPYSLCRSAVRYSGKGRSLILALKHGDRTDLAPDLAAWLARAGRGVLDGADIVAPVPLHFWRFVRRRYNQSALVAEAVAARTDVTHVPGLLQRTRATPTQGGLSREGRRRNVQGAFRVDPRHAGALKGRTVVLIDDVMTTGATVEACARVLKRAGAADVKVLTLARVVLTGGHPIS